MSKQEAATPAIPDWRELLMRVVCATGRPNPTNPREHRVAPGMGMAFSAAIEDATDALNGAALKEALPVQDRAAHDCALKRGSVFCRECDLETIERESAPSVAPAEPAVPPEILKRAKSLRANDGGALSWHRSVLDWVIAQGSVVPADAPSPAQPEAREALIAELQRENAALRQKLAAADSFARSVNEALNTGDGSYRP
jgi:hypothetical protein